jgi:hypothetical protein
MADFDPNAYLQADTPPAGAFDPAAYLASVSPPSGREQVGGGEALARGAGQGATLGFADELTGLMQAIPAPLRALLGPAGMVANASEALAELTSDVPESQRATARAVDAEKDARTGLGERFRQALETGRQARDSERRANAAAQEDQPAASLVGQVAGGLPLAIATGGTGAARAVGQGAALGGASSLGGSTADLTKGEVGQAALDTAIGAGAGAAAGGLGYGLTAALGKVAGKAGDALRRAFADQAAKTTATREAAMRSARSALGGEASAALNALAKAREVAENALGTYTPEQVTAARAFLASPAAQEAMRNAAQNVLEAGPERLVGSMQTARNAFDTAKGAATPQAIDAAVDEAMAHPIRTTVLPRVANYANRAIPTAIGAAVGGPAGAVIGGTAGAVLGNPGTALRNMITNPAFRGMVARGAKGAAEGLGEVALPGALTLEQAIMELLRQKEEAPVGP